MGMKKKNEPGRNVTRTPAAGVMYPSEPAMMTLHHMGTYDTRMPSQAVRRNKTGSRILRIIWSSRIEKQALKSAFKQQLNPRA
jgi:hypothetical protein